MRSLCCKYVFCLLIACCLFVFTGPATAQTPRFGMYLLNPLTGVKDVVVNAINKRGECVGYITFTGNSETHAFLYLPVARDGISGGMTDLHELAELGGDHSIAHDINDFMQIVGEHEDVAHVWDMVGYAVEHEDWSRSLGTLGGSTSVAYAISTAHVGEDPQVPTPIIVGASTVASGENCPMGVRWRGFAVEYDLDEEFTFIPLGSSRTNQQTFAYDAQSVFEGNLVGFSEECPAIPEPGCNYRFESLSWDPSDSYDVNDMTSIPDTANSDDYRARTLCINRDGQASGWCGEPGVGLCQHQIHFWSSVSATPEDLHSPFFSGDEETQGNGIRDEEMSERIQIAGADTFNNIAYLWEGSTGDWDLLELIDYIHDAGDCGVVKFTTASDINEYGQIAVVANLPGTPTIRRSYILSDRTNCPADLTAANPDCLDGWINVYDLFLLLANWNTDGAGAELASPTNVVDVNDLFYLLGHWGFCNGTAATLLETEEDCFEKFPLTEIEALISCLEAVHEME